MLKVILLSLFLVACGGSVEEVKLDASDDVKPDSRQDSGFSFDSNNVDSSIFDACDDTNEGLARGCPGCLCTSIGFICNGQLQDDAQSCLQCGVNCNSGDK